MGFIKRDEQRIARTVQEWERFPRERQFTGIQNGTSVGVPQFAIADEDIEHGDFGDVSYASGSTFDGTLTPNTSRLFNAYNPGKKVWDGATVLLQHCRLPQSGKNQWVIVQAWSATRIECTAPAGGITAGNFGICGTITALDGHYGYATASVTNWTTSLDIGGSEVLRAELDFRSSFSNWYVYAADC